MRLGKGSGLYGCCSMAYTSENYGIIFIRPLLYTSREIIENLMKNYGYFLDGTRNMDFQRNNLRKLHKRMDGVGLTMKNISITIEKNQQMVQWIKNASPIPSKGYNWYHIKKFFSCPEIIQYNLLRQGVTHINPNGSWDMNDMILLKKQNFTKYGCWFIIDEDLFITGAPMPKHQKKPILIKQGKTCFYLQKLWIKNNRNDDIIINTLDQWITNKEKNECLIWPQYLKKYKKYLIKTFLVLIVNNSIIVDETMEIIGYNHSTVDMNKFFITI